MVRGITCLKMEKFKSPEAVFRIPDYLANHPDLDTKTRAILVDWHVELQGSFALNHETLHDAVKIADMYLAKSKNVSKDKIQMVASAAIFIAANYDETNRKFTEHERFQSSTKQDFEHSPPLADDLIYLAGDRFDRSLLMAMERELFSTIEFDLGSSLSYRYLRRLARVTHSDMASLTLARYLLDSSLLIYDYSMISASQVSCVAFVLTMRMKDNTYGWNFVLVQCSRFPTKNIYHSMCSKYIKRMGADKEIPSSVNLKKSSVANSSRRSSAFTSSHNATTQDELRLLWSTSANNPNRENEMRVAFFDIPTINTLLTTRAELLLRFIQNNAFKQPPEVLYRVEAVDFSSFTDRDFAMLIQQYRNVERVLVWDREDIESSIAYNYFDNVCFVQDEEQLKAKVEFYCPLNATIRNDLLWTDNNH